jgi:hypothetical protein
MTSPRIDTTNWEKPRQRLFRRYRHYRSWRVLARDLEVNVYYLYEYTIHGIRPSNPQISKALGIHNHRTINDHLAHDPIQDLPIPLLEWSLLHREEL